MPVYFLRAETLGLIKIGFSEKIESRLASLRIGRPDALTLLGVISGSTPVTEREVHAQFEGDRVRGEWFHPSDELETFVRSHCGDVPAPLPLGAEWAFLKQFATNANVSPAAFKKWRRFGVPFKWHLAILDATKREHVAFDRRAFGVAPSARRQKGEAVA
jgi:hypothetical protein